MRPSEALAKHRDEVLQIISRYPVSNPRVFGSAARGEDVEGSDLDILVEKFGILTYIDLASLEIELERLLKVPVGVHTPASLALRRRCGSSSTGEKFDGRPPIDGNSAC